MKPSILFFLAVLSSGALAQSESALVSPLLQPFVERHELAGAVALVADSDGVRHAEAVGFADIGAGKAMQEDALFWIASQSKPMTAVAVMMLVDEGRIALDRPVEEYLPEFRGQMVVAERDDDRVLLRKPAHPITVREVLSHMSGLPFRSRLEEPRLDQLPLESAVRSYAMTPLETEPGTAYRYSNAGINTAARIIEVVTGSSYEQFMQERLFDPLGMPDTTFWPTEAQLSRLAKSYRPDAAKTGLEEFAFDQLTQPLTDTTRRFPMPAGGLFSTARDTAQFCRMMLNGGQLDGKRYLSEDAFRELTSRQTPESVDAQYGLGFAIDAVGFGHGGAHATHMEILPARGIALIWMVQHGGFPGKGAESRGVFRNWAIERFGK